MSDVGDVHHFARSQLPRGPRPDLLSLHYGPISFTVYYDGSARSVFSRSQLEREARHNREPLQPARLEARQASQG